ncbi:hypothetical protein [Corticicoccus populi]|uniref:Uncharacterized protein n=1 Tax=Corticicoccus populi TaxID=1812821 RepID=A0ABW5WW92_9STAP
MKNSIGYEIAFSYDKYEDAETLAPKVLYLTKLKSNKNWLIDISTDDFNRLLCVVIKEEGINKLSYAYLGDIVYKEELVFHNISLNDDVDSLIIDDIKNKILFTSIIILKCLIHY